MFLGTKYLIELVFGSIILLDGQYIIKIILDNLTLTR